MALIAMGMMISLRESVIILVMVSVIVVIIKVWGAFLITIFSFKASAS